MPSLTSLAEQMLAQAKVIDGFLEQKNIPYTSFDEDTLESLPEEIQKVRWDLLDTSHIFKQLVRGPAHSGLDIAFSWTEQLVLRIIWRYNIPSAIPIDGSATYDEISAASGLGKSLVIRTIRTAITLNIFDESEPGRIRHTAISRLLATNDGYFQSIGLQVEDIGPAGLRLIEAWEKYGDDAGQPDQSAFSLNNGGRSLFTVLQEEPERARRFDSSMKYFIEDKDMSFSHVIEAFDWSTLDKPGARLIDLGGGYGQVSQALAKHTNHLSFTIQDLPHVIEQGQKKLPPEFAERISFEPKNFLESQDSEKKPDAYLISRCLHNWSDSYCTEILRALIPALREGSKILIWDSVISERPPKKLTEKFNLQQDFIMATISNGKDRSLEEFRAVLEKSDTRFKIDSVRAPEGTHLSMIIVSWSC